MEWCPAPPRALTLTLSRRAGEGIPFPSSPLNLLSGRGVGEGMKGGDVAGSCWDLG